jgi:hypothetical protein
VSNVVKRALRRAGIKAPAKGAHLLRHYLPSLTMSCNRSPA